MSQSLVLSFSLSLCICLCLSRAVDAWEKDISVHPLILPQSTCEEVLQLLSSSTETLPSSLCSMNCYQVRITLLGNLFLPNFTNTLSASITFLIFCIFGGLWPCWLCILSNTTNTHVSDIIQCDAASTLN